MDWLLWPFFLLAFAYLVSTRQRAATGKRVRQAREFNPSSIGSSRFAPNDDLRKAGLFGSAGVPIGYALQGWRALRYSGVGHILTVAAARTGKGATLLINALLSHKGSCLVICPKCENTVITAHYRRRYGEVLILNPFGMFLDKLQGLKLVRFNPMDVLDPTSDAFHAGCDKLAAALVWDDGPGDRHWTTAARILVSGIIAAIKRHGTAGEQNLVAVARVISGDVFGFCQTVVASTTDPFIIQKLARFAASLAEDSREIQGVLATAIAQLGFLGNAAIAQSLSGSDFRFRDLKRMCMTIYICLPLYMLDVCDRYFRLLTEVFLMELLSEQQRSVGRPVLAIIDEMAQLGGHMKSLENAMGMAAGAAGLQLWCVLQDLSQLKGMFPNTWETFIQNCGVTMWFGARDQTSRDYVSRLAGTHSVVIPSKSVSFDRASGEPQVSEGTNVHTVPLIAPHEIGQLPADQMIAFIDGVRCGPVKVKRRFYFKCPELRGRFRPNPYFRK